MESETLFQAFIASALESANERDDLRDKMCISFTMYAVSRASRDATEAFYETVAYDPEFAFEIRCCSIPSCITNPGRATPTPSMRSSMRLTSRTASYSLEPEWREKPCTLYPFSGSLMRANPEMPL